MPDVIAQFVLRVGGREVGCGVAPGPALDRDDVQARLGEFLREDRAGPAEADDDDVGARQLRPGMSDLSLAAVDHRLRPAPMLTGGSG